MGKYASKETTPGVMIWPGSTGIVTYAGGATWGPPLESIAVIEYPDPGIPYSTGSGWGTSHSLTGTGTVIALQNEPVFIGAITWAASKIPNSINDHYIANAGGVGSYSNINVANDLTIRASSANVVITARNATGDIKFATGAADTQKAVLTNAGLFGVGLTPSDSMYVDSYGSMRINNGGGLYLKNGYSAIIKNPNNNTRDIGFYQDSDALKYFFKGSGQMYIDGGLHIGGTSEAGDNNLWIDGIAQEPNFTPGWQGSNWQIQADGDAEFNNVRIRGGLSVYELIINQLHYQNGGLIIGAGAGKVDTIVSATVGSEVLTFHDPEGNDMVPFTDGAIVMVQRVDISKTVANGYTGDVVKKIVRQVASVSGMEVTLTSTAGWTPGDPAGDDTGIIEIGDELCAIGHVSNTALDSALYLSATDADNPFLRVMDGVSSYAKWSLGDKTTCKLQLGNLASLASYDIIPASPGYGLYCDNVYLNGRVVLPTAGITNEGASASDIRIYAGESYANRATAPFRVTQNGSLTATGVAELGTATATIGGKASNVAIIGPDIWENAYDGDNSSIHINRMGYNGGITKYRDFVVYDGKGHKLLLVAGSTPGVYFGNNVDPIDVDFQIFGDLTADGDKVTLNGAHAQATGSSNITAPASESDMTNMSITLTPKGNKLFIMFSCSLNISTPGWETALFKINVGGSNVQSHQIDQYDGTNSVSFQCISNVTAGSSVTVKIRWEGTSTHVNEYGYRILTVCDIF